MKNSGRNTAHQRKIYLTVLIIIIILAAVFVGVYYLWKQTKTESEMKVSGQAERSQTQNDADTIEYQGSTYKYNDHLSNYLFMGIDTRENVDTYESQKDAGQADSIFLVSMDRATEQLKVLFIPRDSMTKIEVFNPSGKSLGMTTDHINIQYAYGDGKQKSCELMKTAVSNMLDGVAIQGYCSMNMDGIAALTDFVGGVEITVPDSSLEDVNPDFKEGSTVTLTGENAEQFVHYRDTKKSQSALVRQERQKTYIQALLKKCQDEASQNAGFVADLYSSIKDYTVTSMGNDVFAKLLVASQNGISDTQTVPGQGTEGENFDEYHIDEDALTEMIISMFYEKND